MILLPVASHRSMRPWPSPTAIWLRARLQANTGLPMYPSGRGTSFPSGSRQVRMSPSPPTV